ncbi:MAG: hypothetical protein HC813_03390, partial [Planctomycetes bacterium]|nr:hypothetical protein [Planctomycetota bacterium]
MTAALLLALLADPGPRDLDLLDDPSREVRERAVEALAHNGPATAELVPLLTEGEARRAALIARVLERRGDLSALPALLRLAGQVA